MGNIFNTPEIEIDEEETDKQKEDKDTENNTNIVIPAAASPLPSLPTESLNINFTSQLDILRKAIPAIKVMQYIYFRLYNYICKLVIVILC